ncbi:MAG: tetratricopeptide repeat protein [Pseudolabrys sp.]
MPKPQIKPQSANPGVADILRRAVDHHQRGQLTEAEALYRQVLAVQPGNFDALHLCGVLVHQRNQPAEALQLIARALKTNARSAAAHSNYGIVLAVLDRHDEALKSYERAVKLKPDYAEALNNRGNTLRALKRANDALLSFERAIAARPGYSEAINNRGNALVELGRHEEALASYEQALSHRPAYPDALVNRGQCLAKLNRHDEALASIERALSYQPRHAAALKERGHLLRDRKQLAEALNCYEQALAIAPDDAVTHANRGLVLRDLKRFNEAFTAYDRALALKPDYVEVVVARGNVFYELHAYDQALAEYERALEMQPDFAFGFNNRGNALNAMGRHDEALASYEHALALKPDYTEAHNNRGNALLDLNRPEEALADYESAVAHKPQAFALVNRGSALRYLDRTEEALDSFDRAIALDPELAEAHWNKALLCLALGDFERGWAGYEWRWRGATDLTSRGFRQPQWRGEDLTGKTILLHAEQGFGDSIQFVRYVPLVARRGAKIVLELPDSLVPLIGRVDGVIGMCRRGDALPQFDVHCPLLSLPLAFGTTIETIPASVPYLHAPAERVEKWRARFADLERPRIGLVWSGKPSHKNDHNRSIALSQLEPLLSLAGVQFVSLQREYRDSDLPVLNRLPVLRIDDALTDFAETAAAIGELDLVIAVDTAVAHLAGALGKPLWLLVSHIQDWRWLVQRTDSPWYPSARLFRQPRIGEWDVVIAGMGHELAEFSKACGTATK